MKIPTPQQKRILQTVNFDTFIERGRGCQCVSCIEKEKTLALIPKWLVRLDGESEPRVQYIKANGITFKLERVPE